MKPKEIGLNTQLDKTPSKVFDKTHLLTSWENPIRMDGFDMNDEEKVKKIEHHFKEIMHTLGLDLTDESLQNTPHRVAKMYVKEVFSGLNPKNRPHPRLFNNTYQYNQMLVEKDITFYSYCEHHFVPIYGKAHVAYFSTGKVIGLSKINRIVQYYSKRPQVQERLTVQIGKEIEDVLNTKDVGVVMEAHHMCIASRGVGDTNSKTGTAYFSGKFLKKSVKREYLNYINVK